MRLVDALGKLRVEWVTNNLPSSKDADEFTQRPYSGWIREVHDELFKRGKHLDRLDKVDRTLNFQGG